MLSSIYNFIGINNQPTENPEETKEISKEAWVLLNNSDISGKLVHFDEDDHRTVLKMLNFLKILIIKRYRHLSLLQYHNTRFQPSTIKKTKKLAK